MWYFVTATRNKYTASHRVYPLVGLKAIRMKYEMIYNQKLEKAMQGSLGKTVGKGNQIAGNPRF